MRQRMIVGVIVLLAGVAMPGFAEGPWSWFHPKSIIIIGGRDSGGHPTASPELLRAQCIEAALEMSKSFPGEQNGIAIFWSPRGPAIETLPEHWKALKRGLQDAVKILGGPDKLIFISWVFSPEARQEIRRELGINIGTFNFEYWRMGKTTSRLLANADVGLNLLGSLAKIPGDVKIAELKTLAENREVTFDLISQDGVRFGSTPLYDRNGNIVQENFAAEEVICKWEAATRKSGELFKDSPAFVGVTFDEPMISLNDQGQILTSPEIDKLYQQRYHEPMPAFPAATKDRRGKKFAQMSQFYTGLMNPFIERTIRALKQASPALKATSPLVSVEYPWSGYDYLNSKLDILQCDPYVFMDLQMVYPQIEQQLYDDGLGKIYPSGVNIVFPRRAVWKLMNTNRWAWMHGEIASWTRSFRRLTPQVNHVTDELVMKHLNDLSGILVWPIARVTSAAEDAKLLQWVKQGNVLLLSRAEGFDELLEDKPASRDPLLSPWLASTEGGQLLSSPVVGLPDGQAAELHHPVRALKLRHDGKEEILAVTKDGLIVAAGAPVGKGWVLVALGGESDANYPSNIELDKLLVAVAERAMQHASLVPAVLTSDASRLLLLNENRQFLTVFAGVGTGEILLSTNPAAYGRKTVDLKNGDGSSVPRRNGRYVLTFAPGEQIKLLSLK